MKLVGIFPRRGRPFKKISALLELIKCGLVFLTTPFIDKVGKNDYTATPGESLVGDGITYVIFDWVQASQLWDIEFEIDVIPSGVEVLVDARFNSGVGLVYSDGVNMIASGGAVVKNGNKYTIADYTMDFTKLTFFSNFGIGQKWNETLSYFKMTRKSDGKTYILNPSSITSDDIVTLYNELDHTDKIEGIQFLAPDPRTVENFTVESMEDRYGRSISKALGKNLFDKDSVTDGKYIGNDGTTILSNVDRFYSDYIFIDSSTDYYFTNVNGGFISLFSHFYDEDKNWISAIGTNAVTSPSNAKYVIISEEIVNKDTIQLELGSVPTTYEPYIGYFRDDTLLLPIPYGESMPASKTGKIYNFISDGLGGSVQPLADDLGPIQINFGPVDGVVDNEELVEYGRWNFTVGATLTKNEADGFRTSIIYDVKANQLYTWYNGVKGSKFIVLADSSNVITRLLGPVSDGFQFTTTATEVKFVTYQSDGYPTLDLSTIAMYLGDPNPLPTSGIFESGNSIIMQDDYNAVRGTDVTNVFYNPDGTAKVVPFDDLANITNQQVFVSEDKQTIAYFGEPLEQSSDCDHKARRYVDINEQYFVTIEGAPGTYEPYMVETFEGSGVYEAMWVLKEGVTYV